MKLINYHFIILFAVLMGLAVSGCNELFKVEKTSNLMDTYVSITTYAYNVNNAHKAIDAAFAEVKRIEKQFSEFNSSTPIARLNDLGYLSNSSEEIERIIRKSVYYSQITKGSFDITVEPILELYRNAFGKLHRPPKRCEINKTLKKVGYQKIIITNSTIRLNNTKITLGGIVKGYAVDRAISILKSYNLSSGMVNAGGDLAGYGKEWTIALQNPDNQKEYVSKFKIMNEGVATSGNYERYFDKNKKFHHIVNPHTGYSANNFVSVTVIAPTAQQADALATAVYVEGVGGIKLLERLGLQYLIITNNKTIIKSKGFPEISR